MYRNAFFYEDQVEKAILFLYDQKDCFKRKYLEKLALSVPLINANSWRCVCDSINYLVQIRLWVVATENF